MSDLQRSTEVEEVIECLTQICAFNADRHAEGVRLLESIINFEIEDVDHSRRASGILHEAFVPLIAERFVAGDRTVAIVSFEDCESRAPELAPLLTLGEVRAADEEQLEEFHQMVAHAVFDALSLDLPAIRTAEYAYLRLGAQLEAVRRASAASNIPIVELLQTEDGTRALHQRLSSRAMEIQRAFDLASDFTPHTFKAFGRPFVEDMIRDETGEWPDSDVLEASLSQWEMQWHLPEIQRLIFEHHTNVIEDVWGDVGTSFPGWSL